MKSEELAVIIFEECSSKTRSTKDCVEAIKLRTGLSGDIDDSIRRYRQAGSGLEKVANEVLTLCGSGCFTSSEGVQEVVGGSNYDTFVTLFNQKGFQDPQTCARLCVILEQKKIQFDVHTVEELEEDNYSCGNFGIKVGESLYLLDSYQRVREYATECRAEAIAENAWEYARDEVRDMDTDCLLEYGGYYDGVKSYDNTDKEDEILIELNA